MPDFTPDAPGLDRRQLLVGSAIAVPAIMLTTAVPAHATSADSALSVDIAGTTVTAGGSSNVTATVLNSQGLGWAGQTVTLVVTGPSGATLASTTGTTDSAGQYATTLNVDSFTANGATITVTATSGPLTSTDTTTVTGGVTLTLATAAQITAGAANTVTATLKNASNVGISGQTITFSKAGIDGTYNSVTATTNASGVASVTLTPNTWSKPGATATLTASGPASTTATASALVLGANALIVGYNNTWQMGVGDTNNRSALTQPLRVFPSPITQVVSGGLYDGTPGYFTYFLLEDGSVWSVGKNNGGQLGVGDTSDRSIPTKIAWFETNGIKIAQIAAGDDSGYALTVGGDVYAWGSADGIDGLGGSRTNPVKKAGLGSNVKAVAAHGGGAYVVTSANGVMAWGRGPEGQLGNSTWGDSYTPVNVSGLSSGVDKITANQNTGYALLSSGEVRAWGAGGYGQLGNGSTSNSNVPVTVSGLGSASGTTQIVAAYRTAYALVGDSVRAWGANDSSESGTRHYGMVGNNSSSNRSTPATVIASGSKNIGASSRNAYVEMTDGTFRSWSYNGDAQLGNSGNGGEPWTPISANSTLAVTGRKIVALEQHSFSSLISAYVTDYLEVP
ncbi:hypothetical protein [Microbacterium sp. SLBN-146]|uniref:hypothetical protein n=1 Tax=Microbacterium sp. SLBN-146 TaxID=2768457 RepID=UPI0011518614|nr:hypothetical protein [Microbacterium sp. SLBN-146]TQJ30876.1 alpha-tubulin suppressor-like RCC1 family protein [Microbacterium sp. SLBN-146]